jgi:hypothetical protein
MNSRIKFIFLFFIILNPLFLFGNDEVPIPIDTIELGNIRIFNQVLQTEFGLFTKHSNINNFSIIVKNIARYYPANNIPFNSFTDDMFFIIIYSEYFNYVFLDENNFDYIFIERVEPNDDIILTRVCP